MDEIPFELIVVASLLLGIVASVLVWLRWRSGILSIVACMFFLIAGVVITWPGGGPPPQQRAAENENSSETGLATKLATFDAYRPQEVPADAYVASDACIECHADNHASWHASYHRTMTQVATPAAVQGDFNDARVHYQGRDYHLTREGEISWAVLPDPDEPPSAQTMMQVPILMATGSHHMQIYWYPTGMARMMSQLPIVYLKETNQWIPRTSAFLEPADTAVCSEMGRWNGGCSQCHSTHRRERYRQPGTWDTLVSEFGISCEACHDAGKQHITFHRSGAAKGRSKDPIVNPANLTADRSADVCGQCHSIHSFYEKSAKRSEYGHGYRPGDELSKTHNIWLRDSEALDKMLSKMEGSRTKEQMLRQSYWDDGMVKVSGREYNGLIESGCYQRGEMSCLSCHSMHQSADDERSLTDWANDQMSTAGLSDHACTQCHDSESYGQQHTHHATTSSGARCYNCHMPHTTYGLLKAIRSHTISSPDIKKDLKAKRPNACNLCHVDQSLQWAADKMYDWYGTEKPDLNEEQKNVAAALLWLLKGDAGERALAAWNMGWSAAHEASGNEWIAPHMAKLLNDPYDAVRFVARRSLRSLPGFEKLDFNAMAAEPQRLAAMKAVHEMWQEARKPSDKASTQILIDADGIQEDRVNAILKTRDDTRVRLIE